MVVLVFDEMKVNRILGEMFKFHWSLYCYKKVRACRQTFVIF